MSRPPRAPRRRIRLLLAVVAASLLSLGTVASTPSPAGAAWLGYYAAVPVGAWGSPYGNSAYRLKLQGGPWGDFIADKALVTECNEYSTRGEVDVRVDAPGYPTLGVHVLAPDRFFACNNWVPQ